MDKGKIYLAARYSRRDEMKALATQLSMAGFVTTSRWLHEDAALDHALNDFPPSSCQETAIADLADIDKAEMIVFFAEDPTVGIPRGGRHFELGWAAAKGKSLVVIGGAENVFHYLPQVLHFPTFQAFIEHQETFA